MRIPKKDVQRLEKGGATVRRQTAAKEAKKDQPEIPVAAPPTLPPVHAEIKAPTVDMMPTLIPAIGAEIVGAINGLTNKIDTMMKNRPEPAAPPRPTPFRFRVIRDKRGLIESCIAEPIGRKDA